MASYLDHSSNGREPQTTVPIAVWRLDDRVADEPDDATGTDPGGGFASRLARRLILVYSDPGDTIVGFDDDPHLRGAAHHTGRLYLPIIGFIDVADIERVTTPVTLVIGRWPRSNPTVAAARGLFYACRLMMRGAGCVIAAIRPASTGTTFAEHEQTLRHAAAAAGFANTLQIVAINGSQDGDGDQFLYYATDRESANPTKPADGTSPQSHVDLLVFTSRSR